MKPRCQYEHLPNGKFRVTFLNESTGVYEQNFQEPELTLSEVEARIVDIMDRWRRKYGE
jgi:hypothetical protein